MDKTLNKNWYKWNKDTEIPELLIYDIIGFKDCEGNGVTVSEFKKELDSIKKKNKELNIRINSPGGIVHDGFAIYNLLKQSGLKINVYIDALAASMASVIAMVGDNIYIPATAEIMIHNAWGCICGDAKAMKTEAGHLEELTNLIAGVLADKTGIKQNEILKMMEDETWMTGEVAVEKGFATEIIKDAKLAACVFDLDNELLKNLPENFKKYQKVLQKRQKEHNLRDAGCSRSKAKQTLANQRDAEQAKQFEIIKNKANNYLIKEIREWVN